MTYTFSEFQSGMSKRPPQFCLKTRKDTTFFIIERLNVSKGSDHSNLTLLSPLTFLVKVFRTPRKIGRQHIHFPQCLLQEFLQRTTVLLCMINPINSMDCCDSSEFPKMKVLFLEMQFNKTQIQTNPNTDFEKSLWPLLRSLKIFIIPLFNHQYQLLNTNFSSLNTLRKWILSYFPLK